MSTLVDIRVDISTKRVKLASIVNCSVDDDMSRCNLVNKRVIGL